MRRSILARLVLIVTVIGIFFVPLPASSATGLVTDKVVSAHQSSFATTIVSPAFTTSQNVELLVAFVTTDGPAATGSQQFSSVTGGGLTWRLRQRTNVQYGAAEIWQAVTTGILTNARVTATHSGSYQGSITVATFTGADTNTDGAVLGANASTGAPTATITTTRTGSWIWAVGNDWTRATARTVPTGQTKVDEYLASSGDTFWVQRQATPGTATAPSSVTMNDTAPTTDMWNMSLIEILPSGGGAPDVTPPTVALTSPANGSTVSGTIAVTANASDNQGVVGVQFKLDGANLSEEATAPPYSVHWDTTTVAGGSHTLTAVARDAAGNTATATAVSVTVNNSGSDPAVVGSWGPVQPWPEVSIHAALTNTGKVLTFAGDFTQGGQQYLLDPATGNYIQVPNAAADLFCAGQAVLPDGRILVIGGTATNGGLGIRDVTAFNPGTEAWQVLAPMHYPRWYPTGTTLGDGRVLVTSGANTSATDIVPIPEVYDTQHNAWSDLAMASRNIPYYPFMYQLPDGRVLQAGASEQATSTLALNVATQQWSTIDSRVIDAASITNYAPGKFMKAGSASDGGFSGQSSNSAFTLDMNVPSATWQPTASMQFPRSFVNLTNLPDGTVLATGGGTDRSGRDETKAVKPAEIWNPATGVWTTVASLTAARLYHSTALLLPDGRVFVSGGGGDTGVTDEKNYQIYSPAYLFKGARPTISAVPATLQYNANTFVQTPNASDIRSVSLIRTGSVTHSFDQNTRALSLPFTQASGGLNVQMPSNGNYAPPGYYMLSIVDANGIPSVASVVRFPAPLEDTIAPTAPTNLTATPGSGQISLAWNASTDNVGVTRYNISRDGTRVGTATGTTFADGTVVAGTTYSYTVTAQDAAGNIRASSDSATATASGGRTITVDRLVTVHQSTSAATFSATGLTTTGNNQLLLAFISSDGPSGGGTASIASVSGAGLSWTLRQRTNAQAGTAEIWQAVSPGPLTNAAITARQSSGAWQSAMTVVAFNNADTANGATVGANGGSGAPSASLTTTRAGSWVWGVGTDWDASLARSMGPGQTLVDQYFPPGRRHLLGAAPNGTNDKQRRGGHHQRHGTHVRSLGPFPH